jgi:hypothetical protein
MAQSYVIVCVEMAPSPDGSHAHVRRAGVTQTLSATTAEKTIGVGAIRAAIDTGDAFVTISPSTGAEASVEKVTCDQCDSHIIRSRQDAGRDNNPDHLRPCLAGRVSPRWAGPEVAVSVRDGHSQCGRAAR